ncbi:Ig-like domain-containing protein [Nocardioides sp. GCM10027113]|uniref:L,D-transpeptidase n=1 Tax=unclassified Nocardioides TaxID=2615069 RepID=UPI00361499A0
MAVLTAGLSACETGRAARAPGEAAEAADAPAEAPEPAFELASSVRRGATVPVDREVSLAAEAGRLTGVRVSAAGGEATAELAGELADDGSRWVAADRLEPGTRYTVRVEGERTDGSAVQRVLRFRTEDLTLDQQTYPSVAPLQGETVGVGMPVVVTFDVPVTDRASFEKHMTVTSTPRQPGAWRWLSDREAHWRPKSYWEAGSRVRVDVDVNSVAAGNGIYGQESRTVDFRVGDAHVYRVDAQTHQMRVFSNGTLLRTLPITTGKPGFTTRSGTKVIMEKFRERRMNSETVGIGEGDPEYYDIDDVEYAMRLTYSGEFIHAAPWSVGSQGSANVSHGCTGMSTADAGWLYNMTRRGDVVEYTGTDRPMTLTNGFGDWNVPFREWKQGSALT